MINNKYLFLYLKTGGGHLAPAKAVARYLKQIDSNTEIILADAFENSGWLVRFVVEEGYRFLQRKAKWIYEVIYAVNKFSLFSESSAKLVSDRVEKQITNLIINEKPTKIVIFHFFLIKPVYKILKKHNLNLPVITVVTDPYIAHPLWFLNEEQNFILFSEQLKKHCLKKGISENNINVFPFILDEKFSQKPSPNHIEGFRKKNGFNSGKILLILGGGDGIPKGKRLLESILHKDNNFEVAIICGKNKKLFDQAQKIKADNNYDHFKVFGYVDFVYELINISDVVITKCGASTFMEILISEKVPVVNSYIWEQEKGNVDFIVDNSLGIYETNIKKLNEVVNRLFDEPEYLNYFKNNIKSLKLEIGTKRVGDYINSAF